MTELDRQYLELVNSLAYIHDIYLEGSVKRDVEIICGKPVDVMTFWLVQIVKGVDATVDTAENLESLVIGSKVDRETQMNELIKSHEDNIVMHLMRALRDNISLHALKLIQYRRHIETPLVPIMEADERYREILADAESILKGDV